MLKKLAGHTAIYGLTTIAGRFLNYLLTPLHTSILLPSEYGVVTSIYAYIAFLNVVYTYGMETAYFRFSTKDASQSNKSFQNAFLSVFFSSLIFTGFIYLFSNQIASFLGYANAGSIVRWVSYILALDAISAIPFAKLRLLKKVYLFSAAKILSILINIFLNVFFLYFCPAILNDGLLPEFQPFISSFYNLENPLRYIFIANLVANFIYLPFILSAFKSFRLGFDFDYFKTMFWYSFPILLTGLAGTVNEMFSRLMLERMLPNGFYPHQSNLDALGVFGACYKMAVFMTISIQAFRFASEPFFFSNAKDKNAPEMYARVMHFFVLACMCIFLIVSVNVDWLSSLFLRNEIYKTGLNIVPVLLLANVFMGIYFNLSIWYKLTDKTFWGTYITLGGAAITVVSNIVLIPYFGYSGSVWATFVTYFTMVVFSYFIGQKYFKVPYNIYNILFIIGFGIMLFWICSNIDNQTFMVFLIKNSIVVAFPFLGYFIGKKIKLLRF